MRPRSLWRPGVRMKHFEPIRRRPRQDPHADGDRPPLDGPRFPNPDVLRRGRIALRGYSSARLEGREFGFHGTRPIPVPRPLGRLARRHPGPRSSSMLFRDPVPRDESAWLVVSACETEPTPSWGELAIKSHNPSLVRVSGSIALATVTALFPTTSPVIIPGYVFRNSRTVRIQELSNSTSAATVTSRHDRRRFRGQ